MESFGQKTAEEKAVLHIGVYTFYKATGLSRMITSFIKENVNTLCTMKIVDNYAAYSSLESGDLDFAILKSRPEFVNRRFTHIELVKNDPLVVMTAKGSQLAKKETVHLSELGELKLTTGDRNSHLYRQMEKLYQENKQDFNISFSTVEDSDMITELISEGFSDTLATRSVADALTGSGITGVPIEPPQLLTTYLAYRKNARLGGAEKAFIAHIKKEFGVSK